MPSDESSLRKLGAVVERVPPAPIIGPTHFVNRARSLAAEHTADPAKPGRGYLILPFDGTGPEIYDQCGRRLDAFVAAVGTGGTIAGVARYLKPRLPDVQIAQRHRTSSDMERESQNSSDPFVLESFPLHTCSLPGCGSKMFPV